MTDEKSDFPHTRVIMVDTVNRRYKSEFACSEIVPHVAFFVLSVFMNYYFFLISRQSPQNQF